MEAKQPSHKGSLACLGLIFFLSHWGVECLPGFLALLVAVVGFLEATWKWKGEVEVLSPMSQGRGKAGLELSAPGPHCFPGGPHEAQEPNGWGGPARIPMKRVCGSLF